MSAYARTVCAEIIATAGAVRRRPTALHTVYVGGGTPSLLPAPLLGAILSQLDSSFGIAAGAEITVEADPATFDSQTLVNLASLGVNRLSVGVQAFSDPLLQSVGRTHSVQDIHRSLRCVQGSSSFSGSWSLDLLFGLPRQSLEDWERSLELAVAADPSHIAT
jgi:oxygen-independent coproporphyrinogen-3 oxidase